jgi:hypothetical protein
MRSAAFCIPNIVGRFATRVALDTDPPSGAVTTLFLFDRQASIAAAAAIARWQREEQASVGPCIRRLGAGAVIAQKGL